MSPQSRSDELDLDALAPPFCATDPASRWLFGLHRLGIQPGLERIEALLTRLGDPQRRYPSIVVAGTNGKGTAATYLAALGTISGRRTGLYTSPHFLRVHERVQVDGTTLGAKELSSLVEECRPHIEATKSTYFEAMTAISLLHFARRGVELAVLETGLGGKLDATNAVDAVGVLLTSVGADHQHILGESLAEIAEEKLGLARRGRPFYLGRLSPALHRQAMGTLQDRGAEIVDLGSLPAYEGPLPQTGLAQSYLAAVTMAVYEDLGARHGWPRADARAALAEARVPCRYERLGENPRLLLDTAHNGPALRGVLEQWSAEGSHDDRVLVMGVMRDKRVHEVLSLAACCASSVVTVAPRWYRSLSASELAIGLTMASPPEGRGEIEAADSVREGLTRARELGRGVEARGGRASVLVTGSNFLVAEALDRLGVDRLDRRHRSSLWDQDLPLRRRGKARRRMVQS